jgi:hypothetical protein
MTTKTQTQTLEPKRLFLYFSNTEDGEVLEFYISGEDKIYKVRDLGVFLVEEEIDGIKVGEFWVSHDFLKVKGVWGLYQALKKEPENTLEALLGKRIPIKEVVEVKEDDDDKDIYYDYDVDL